GDSILELRNSFSSHPPANMNPGATDTTQYKPLNKGLIVKKVTKRIDKSHVSSWVLAHAVIDDKRVASSKIAVAVLE
ncbi:MAG: hypothetical protein JSW55_06010, partial [Chloroflexota bacterium]